MADVTSVVVYLVIIAAAVAIARALIVGGKQPDDEPEYWFNELGRRDDD